MKKAVTGLPPKAKGIIYIDYFRFISKPLLKFA